MNNNILIVEDHALTSFALKTSLEDCEIIENIFEAQNAKDALEVVKNNKIDLIIMDIGLPDINGIEACEKIREFNKSVKILILSSHCEKEEVQQCLKNGISAYCTKEIKPQKLKEVVIDVLNGSMYFDSAISKYVIQKNQEVQNNKEEIHVKDCYNLTQQEKRVLILLASGNNNSQIAKKLKISINTIKVHVCSILQKMNVEDRTQAAIKAIRENLII